MFRRTAVVLSFALALAATPLLARHDDYRWSRNSDKEYRKEQKRWAKQEREQEKAWRKARRDEEKRYRKMMRQRDRYRGYRLDPYGYDRYRREGWRRNPWYPFWQ